MQHDVQTGHGRIAGMQTTKAYLGGGRGGGGGGRGIVHPLSHDEGTETWIGVEELF